MSNDDLGRYQGMLPSRAMLAKLSLFGTDEATRASANAILKALPPMNEKERQEYLNETWKLAGLPPEEDLAKSPIGRQTLAMLRANQPMTAQKPEAEGPYPEPKPAEPEAPAAPAIESTNAYMAKLNWPPAPSTPAKDPVDDKTVPHKWQAAKPSSPSRDRQPLPPDGDYSSNQPLY